MFRGWLVSTAFSLGSLTVACGGVIVPSTGTDLPSTGFLPPAPADANQSAMNIDPNTLADPNRRSDPGNPNSGNPSGSPNGGNPNKPVPPAYSTQDLATDMTSVLQRRSPVYSTETLGNPDNVKLWNQAAVDSLHRGILAGHATYYPFLPIKDYAHLLLALGATDSTGDYNLTNSNVGYLQVSVNVGGEFSAHANVIKDPSGNVVADPANLVLTNPGVSAAVFAWSSRNSVSAGESANEIALGLHNGDVVRDVGNGLMAWVCGANQDRHRNPQSGGCATDSYPRFYHRVVDYFVQAGFGSRADFDTILNVAVPSTVLNFKDAPPGAFP